MVTNTTQLKKNKKPRKRDREASKKALLEAAIEVFSERGYDAATTREVAKRAGVSEALIQRYFEGKSGLLLAIIHDFIDEGGEMSLATLPFSKTLEAEIANVIRFHCATHCERSDFIRVVMSRAIVDSNIGRQMGKEIYERKLPSLVSRLLHYRELGLIEKNADLEALAYSMSALSFTLGFMGPEVFGFNRDRLDVIAEKLAQVLAKGVGPK